MKKVISVICLLMSVTLLLTGCLRYETNYKETLRDTAVSPDGNYELQLIELGEPKFPFGSASGRLDLKEGDTLISQTDFELNNDGGRINSSCWTVAWNQDCAEVILSGEEQANEQIRLYFDGKMERKFLADEIEAAEIQSENTIQVLDVEVMENRENELVFTISIDDFIDSYNGFWNQSHDRVFFRPSSEWQWYLKENAIYSDYKTFYVYFTEDEKIYPQSTVSVYVPSNDNFVQEITINFDEHSYSESGYAQYKQMCYYALKVFFPDISDDAIMDFCTQVITLGNEHVFSSDEWYDRDSVPYALFYKDGIGVYPYFAIGDWEHLCIIPVTEKTICDFEEKGAQVYELASVMEMQP